jgi:hypothetical protein
LLGQSATDWAALGVIQGWWHLQTAAAQGMQRARNCNHMKQFLSMAQICFSGMDSHWQP